MACNHPIMALDLGLKPSKQDPDKLVRDIKFLPVHKDWSFEKYQNLYGDRLLMLPCGHCFGCSQSYAREWSSRIMLEAKKYADNCFITLTFDDDHVPERLEKAPFQKFMKRLRKYFPQKIRFFACGECGEKSERPHYHAVLFNVDFDDKEFLKRSKSGLIIYRSKLLEKLWPYGISSIGDVTDASAQYVAKYSMKRKISKIDRGEFVLMSRMPGIGQDSYDESIYESDRIYVSGKSFKVPRYFDKLADKEGSILFEYTKEMRLRNAKKIPLSMYKLGLAHQEEAYKKQEDDAIYKDALKVRL